MRVKHYFDRCYMQNFWLFIDWPEKNFCRELKKKFDLTEYPDNLHDGKTMVMTHDKTGQEIILIWTRHGLRGNKRIKVIAHECLHALGQMYARVGVRYDSSNDEPFTYMQGVLLEECL